MFFRARTGEGPDEIRRPSVGKFYATLLDNEMEAAEQYFIDRMRARGLHHTVILENMKRTPQDVSQHLKLNFMLWVLNGLATSHRVATFHAHVGEQCCYLCKRDIDSIDHLCSCPVSRLLVIEAHAITDGFVELPSDKNFHWMQCSLAPEMIRHVLQINHALWRARCVLARGCAFDGRDLLRFLRKHIQDSWWTTVRKRDRQSQPPVPLVDNQKLYRTDGACRGQRRNRLRMAGAGAAYFGRGSDVLAWCCTCLGEAVTNNIAEYEGILIALRRIDRIMHDSSVIEADSLLVVNQLLGRFAVRNANLKPDFREAMALIRRIRKRGALLEFRYIYREFNQIVDQLANDGADGNDASNH